LHRRGFPAVPCFPFPETLPGLRHVHEPLAHPSEDAVEGASARVPDAEALLRALEADFGGNEEARLLLWNRTPKYGNDDDYADAVMLRVFEAYFHAVEGRDRKAHV